MTDWRFYFAVLHLSLLPVSYAGAVEVRLTPPNVAWYFEFLETYVFPFILAASIALLIGYGISRLFEGFREEVDEEQAKAEGEIVEPWIPPSVTETVVPETEAVSARTIELSPQAQDSEGAPPTLPAACSEEAAATLSAPAIVERIRTTASEHEAAGSHGFDTARQRSVAPPMEDTDALIRRISARVTDQVMDAVAPGEPADVSSTGGEFDAFLQRIRGRGAPDFEEDAEDQAADDTAVTLDEEPVAEALPSDDLSPEERLDALLARIGARSSANAATETDTAGPGGLPAGGTDEFSTDKLDSLIQRIGTRAARRTIEEPEPPAPVAAVVDNGEKSPADKLDDLMKRIGASAPPAAPEENVEEAGDPLERDEVASLGRDKAPSIKTDHGKIDEAVAELSGTFADKPFDADASLEPLVSEDELPEPEEAIDTAMDETFESRVEPTLAPPGGAEASEEFDRTPEVPDVEEAGESLERDEVASLGRDKAPSIKTDHGKIDEAVAELSGTFSDEPFDTDAPLELLVSEDELPELEKAIDTAMDESFESRVEPTLAPPGGAEASEEFDRIPEVSEVPDVKTAVPGEFGEIEQFPIAVDMPIDVVAAEEPVEAVARAPEEEGDIEPGAGMEIAEEFVEERHEAFLPPSPDAHQPQNSIEIETHVVEDIAAATSEETYEEEPVSDEEGNEPGEKAQPSDRLLFDAIAKQDLTRANDDRWVKDAAAAFIGESTPAEAETAEDGISGQAAPVETGSERRKISPVAADDDIRGPLPARGAVTDPVPAETAGKGAVGRTVEKILDDLGEAVTTLRRFAAIVDGYETARESLDREAVAGFRLAGFEWSDDAEANLQPLGENISSAAMAGYVTIGRFNHIIDQLLQMAEEEPLDEGWNELLQDKITATISAIEQACAQLEAANSSDRSVRENRGIEEMLRGKPGGVRGRTFGGE